ncbi:nicotinamide riboside kinase 1 [Penicillium odoratum]|uniref:nicotinamide riboside kinase 1 n=1 Tax=Penicillium odoratum TaxID=1167516 RepID=UPI002548015C|nr:nicotinamide riboside kinase 1 [Penicillium odoratum]KAJ5765692.1 nicotinamide riboside kinase 1 [Penicillium odoratum]
MPDVIFVGLSGPSSSGKTTLAHILCQIFPNTEILHADDFCKEFDQIPTVNGYLDCDGPAGVDFVRLGETLDYMKSHNGRLPDGFKSWQADVFPNLRLKAIELAPVELMENMRAKVQQAQRLAGHNSSRDLVAAKIVFVDGFLLYHEPSIRNRLDLRLFLRLSHASAKQRRFTRPGYGSEAKSGEFWKTEDYFEKMVWRNYVAHHAQFFIGGNVEGIVHAQQCQNLGIEILPGLDRPLEDSLPWAIDQIIEFLKQR